MNITLITAEEQKHYEDAIELQIETESDAEVKTRTGTGAIFCDTFLPKTTISIVEKLGIKMQQRIHNAKDKAPYPYVLLLLNTLEEKSFDDEIAALSRLNAEQEEGRTAALFEWDEKRKTYILLNYSLV